MIRVLIADDFEQMVAVMKNLIEHTPDMTVAGVLTRFQDVLERIGEIEPDVVLMDDYVYPATSALASRQLRALGVRAPILVISMRADPDLIRDSLAAGANGFILKEEFFKHLVPAIRTVCAGQQYLSPMARSVLDAQG